MCLCLSRSSSSSFSSRAKRLSLLFVNQLVQHKEDIFPFICVCVFVYQQSTTTNLSTREKYLRSNCTTNSSKDTSASTSSTRVRCLLTSNYVRAGKGNQHRSPAHLAVQQCSESVNECRSTNCHQLILAFSSF